MGLAVPLVALLGALVLVAAESLAERRGQELAEIPVEDRSQDKD